MAIFQVSGDHLEVTQYGLKLTDRKVSKIALREISPSYTLVSERKLTLGVAALCGSIMLVILVGHIISGDDPSQLLVKELAFVLTITSTVSIRCFLPFTRYEFRDSRGGLVFSVYREIWQSRQADAFIAQLVLCIEAAHGGLSAHEISSHLAKIEIPPPPPRQLRWAASVFFGAVAAFLPVIPRFFPVLADLGALLVMGMSFGALLMCVLSFLAKEPLRWLSIAGATLGLVPPLFY